jgi:hypothetical protein
MLMSKEKIARENRCPECKTGFLSCGIAEDGTGRWEEHCTNCEYRKIHVDCRKKLIPVDFPDRRNNKAPSSLQTEETEKLRENKNE